MFSSPEVNSALQHSTNRESGSAYTQCVAVQERTNLPLSESLPVRAYVLILSVRMSLYIYVCISMVASPHVYAFVCSFMHACLSSIYTFVCVTIILGFSER